MIAFGVLVKLVCGGLSSRRRTSDRPEAVDPLRGVVPSLGVFIAEGNIAEESLHTSQDVLAGPRVFITARPIRASLHLRSHSNVYRRLGALGTNSAQMIINRWSGLPHTGIR